MSELVNRVLVALPLAVAALAAAWYGGGAMLALGLVAAALAMHELWRMARALRPIPLTGHAGGLLIIVAASRWGLSWTVAVVFGLLLATFVVSAGTAARESAVVSIAITVTGALYVGYGIAFLVLLRGLSGPGRFGFNLLLAVLLDTWAGDIFAYFGGRTFGRRRLAPAISPNKTVEGLLCGMVAGTAVGWLTLYGQGLTNLQALLVALAVAIAAPLGDLFESYLKRDLGVKDSGALLGGHGGVLDRIDALLFAGAAAYFVVAALGKA